MLFVRKAKKDRDSGESQERKVGRLELGCEGGSQSEEGRKVDDEGKEESDGGKSWKVDRRQKKKSGPSGDIDCSPVCGGAGTRRNPLRGCRVRQATKGRTFQWRGEKIGRQELEDFEESYRTVLDGKGDNKGMQNLLDEEPELSSREKEFYPIFLQYQMIVGDCPNMSMENLIPRLRLEEKSLGEVLLSGGESPQDQPLDLTLPTRERAVSPGLRTRGGSRVSRAKTRPASKRITKKKKENSNDLANLLKRRVNAPETEDSQEAAEPIISVGKGRQSTEVQLQTDQENIFQEIEMFNSRGNSQNRGPININYEDPFDDDIFNSFSF